MFLVVSSSMLPVNFMTLICVIPIVSGIINCRIACRRCRERLEHPDMLEVYCAMCDECKERRREWLEGAPSLSRMGSNEHYLTNYESHYTQDDCQTTPSEEPCDESKLLTHRPTATTIITTTTTTTTHRPCPPRPCIKTTRPVCPGIACAVPFAVPVCPMCPMYMTGSLYTSSSATISEPKSNKLSGLSKSTSELYFYIGVPKKLLKQLQLSKDKSI